MTKAERRRRYEALTNPTKAADYSTSMGLKDFLAEAKARGDVHPWLPTLPTKVDRANLAKLLTTARLMGEAVRASEDHMIREIAGKWSEPA